ncbi:MAG: hypothetical protein WC969_05530 [Elusimicrobiota bacterium]|jgi:hypothetical protein
MERRPTVFRASAALFAASLFGLAACRGTSPIRYAESSLGFSSVIVGCRVLAPSGETKDGAGSINLESEDERYALDLRPGRAQLLRIEPGVYRLGPTRNLFGTAQPQLRVVVQGRSYRVPFPRDILRLDELDVRPKRVVPLGVLEIQLLPYERGERPKVIVRFDASVATRRLLVEEVIGMMMDPKVPQDMRDSAISWARSLEQALLRVQGERERLPAYKPVP